MTIFFDNYDCYDFNPGAKDVASRNKDIDNARFEQLGWGKCIVLMDPLH